MFLSLQIIQNNCRVANHFINHPSGYCLDADLSYSVAALIGKCADTGTCLRGFKSLIQVTGLQLSAMLVLLIHILNGIVVIIIITIITLHVV